jgi:hypothetical protein
MVDMISKRCCNDARNEVEVLFDFEKTSSHQNRYGGRDGRMAVNIGFRT